MKFPALLLNTCDSYLDVLDIQIDLLTKCGLLDCSDFDVYVNTERQSLDIKRLDKKIIFHKNSLVPWGQRLRSSLKKINHEYVLVLFDDYYPENEFNYEKFSSLMSTIDQGSYDCCYLAPVVKPRKGDSYFSDNLIQLNPNRPFKLNTTAAVWRREALLEVFLDTDDPWSWEAFSSYRAKAKLLKICSVTESSGFQFKYSFSSGGAIYRGGWVASVLKSLDLTKDPRIMKSQRPVFNSLDPVKRDIRWKVKFIAKGFSISVHGAISFLIYALARKCRNLFYT